MQDGRGGLTPDDAKAIKLYHKAADQGHAGVQSMLRARSEQQNGSAAQHGTNLTLPPPPLHWQHRASAAAPSEVTARSELGSVQDLDDFMAGTEASTPFVPLASIGLRGLELDEALSMAPADPSHPFVAQPSDQGNESTCMAHAVMRVVVSQLQHKYGVIIDFDSAVEKLIERMAGTAREAGDPGILNVGAYVIEAISAFERLETGLVDKSKSARFFVSIKCNTFWDFSDLVTAVENAGDFCHIVTGNRAHAVAAKQVDRNAAGKATVLCMDSNDDGNPSFRLGLHPAGGSFPAKKFESFHILETTIDECIAYERSGKKKSKLNVPAITDEWYKRCTPSLVDRLLPHRPTPMQTDGGLAGPSSFGSPDIA